MELAIIGRIVNTHGIRGEIRVYPLMDEPEMLLEYDRVAVCAPGKEPVWYNVDRGRIHKQMAVLKLESVDTMNQAEELKDAELKVPEEELPELPEGRYYIRQLVGLEVHTDDGEYLGTLDHVLETGARDVYSVVDREGRETLLPNIESVILGVDIDRGIMRVHLLPGLRD